MGVRTGRPVGRPAIGPRRDVRWPHDMDVEVQRLARQYGVPVAEVYRVLVERGLEATRANSQGSA